MSNHADVIETGKGYRVQNPFTGEILEQVPYSTDEEIHTAVANAHEAYLEWRERPIEERAALVRRVSELFAERADELGAIIALEMGKNLNSAIGEAAFCESIFGYYAENGPRFAEDEILDRPGKGSALIRRRPLGVILGVMPWNYPYYQVARLAAPNLVLGNTVILKHADVCPRSAAMVESIILEAGIPRGVFQTIYPSHAQVEQVIADDRVQGVSLTGSERAGSIVGSLAGKYLKKVVLELGGSDPYVLLDSEDVKASAALAWKTRMANAGQACNSNKRMIVMDDIYDEFVAELTRLADSLRPGDPLLAEEGTFSPMSSRRAALELQEQIDETVSQGAKVLAGGGVLPETHAFFAPTVLTDVAPGMRAYHEELFGPVALVFKVHSDEEALALANDTPFGLGGAVFSTDVERARAVAERLESGMTNVNAPALEAEDVPFGGVKRSGFGRELGHLGMDEFANKQLVYIAE